MACVLGLRWEKGGFGGDGRGEYGLLQSLHRLLVLVIKVVAQTSWNASDDDTTTRRHDETTNKKENSDNNFKLYSQEILIYMTEN